MSRTRKLQHYSDLVITCEVQQLPHNEDLFPGVKLVPDGFCGRCSILESFKQASGQHGAGEWQVGSNHPNGLASYCKTQAKLTSAARLHAESLKRGL